jgi:hypothetical protein
MSAIMGSSSTSNTPWPRSMTYPPDRAYIKNGFNHRCNMDIWTISISF